ncbi:MAG: SUMF1/EgtB/PvdO family nonheme iron enzyme [Desulfobacteraceae bacterium]|nr:SUMF1/EgtB/PvdO family nonheme iron enzyme [Desulfobacteraceae bacterium]
MKVFISYASEDRETAEKLYNDLKNANMTPWMDEKDIIAGQRRKTEIRRAIENSDCFTALFSSNSVTAKGKIHRELKLAIDILEELPPSDIFIIPAKLDDCHHVYEELKDIQWADLSSYEYGLNQILGALSLSDTEEASQLLINKDKLKKLVSDTSKPQIFSKPGIVFLFALFALFAFIAGIAGISFLLYLHNNEGPRFVIENPFLRSDDSVIIRAANDKANCNRPLDIEFQGILFSEKGIPSDKVSKNGISWQTWLFTFKKYNPPEKYLKNGNYEIRISFAGENDFENNAYKIVFDSELLNVEIRSIKNEDDPARRTFKGVAGKKSMSPENEVTVDIFYYHEGKEEKVNIPVKRIEDIDKGITYFEFETAIYSPVRIDPDDPRYNESFFGFEVRDKTGQKFFRKQSYANYMSEGNEVFSLNDIGDISVAKNIEEKDQKIITTYRYTPDQKRVCRLSNGEYPISLHVTQTLKNERRLEWETNVKDVKPGTIIFRDGEKLAEVAGTDYYIDKKPLDKDKTDYHVEKKGKDGTIYASNTETYTKSEKVMLTIRSNVFNDTVYIDGEKQDRSTRLNVGLEKGKHKILVEKSGCKPHEEEIDLQKPDIFRARLYKTLLIETVPTGATIFVNNVKKDVAPAELEIMAMKTTDIRVELAGYNPQEKPFKIPCDRSQPLKFDLTEQVGRLYVTTHPENALIEFLKLKEEKYSPGMELKPGSYVLRASKQGYEFKDKKVEIISGQDTKEEIKLRVAVIKKNFTNSLKMKFVYIKPSTFMMGSPESEKGRYYDEIQHQVTLTKGFYMQTTEVTQGQWKEVMGNNPSSFKDCGDNCPVENVSWNDVQDFIKKLNKKGEGVYRLPTEAEWEYAARAGSITAFVNGDITNEECDDPKLDKIGWYCGNSGEKTHPVAQKQHNTWGLYDMHGNVWEWCQDTYNSYPSSAVTDPVNTKGSYRVGRGGSWGNNAGYCRSAPRDYYSPDYRDSVLGFRLSRGLTP